MKKIDLEQIKNRLNKSTPGPWKNLDASLVESDSDCLFDDYGKKLDGDDVIVTCFDHVAHTHCGARNWEQREADAEFIAHSRQDIPDLIEAVESLQQRFETIEIAFEQYEKGDINGGDLIGQLRDAGLSELVIDRINHWYSQSLNHRKLIKHYSELDILIYSVPVVVLEKVNDKYLVKFCNTDLVIHFPVELFDASLQAPSTMFYQILEKPSKFRYQQFIPRDELPDQKKIDEIIEMLNGIKLRDSQ